MILLGSIRTEGSLNLISIVITKPPQPSRVTQNGGCLTTVHLWLLLAIHIRIKTGLTFITEIFMQVELHAFHIRHYGISFQRERNFPFVPLFVVFALTGNGVIFGVYKEDPLCCPACGLTVAVSKGDSHSHKIWKSRLT